MRTDADDELPTVSYKEPLPTPHVPRFHRPDVHDLAERPGA
jgi:hypothetical protein